MVRQLLNDDAELTLAKHRVDVAEALGEVDWECLFEEHSTQCRTILFNASRAHLDLGVQVKFASVVGLNGFPVMAEHTAFALRTLNKFGEVERTDHHVLGGGHDRTT